MVFTVSAKPAVCARDQVGPINPPYGAFERFSTEERVNPSQGLHDL